MPEVLPRLMKKGENFGKRNGSGLGLYYAKKTVEEWGRKIETESKLKVGTIVSLSILVTSRHEDVGVIGKCKKMNIKLLPKSFIGVVPVVRL